MAIITEKWNKLFEEADYLETTIEFQNREIQLDINSDAVLGENNWVKEYEEYIS